MNITDHVFPAISKKGEFSVCFEGAVVRMQGRRDAGGKVRTWKTQDEAQDWLNVQHGREANRAADSPPAPSGTPHTDTATLLRRE